MTKLVWEQIIKKKIASSKARVSKKRGWVVLRKSWLTSSINYRMELSEIAVYSKLIVMADECGPVAGLISDNDFRPMPHEYLAHIACCPLEIFESTLKKCIEDDSIYENAHGIFLTHFDEYQFTEYDRQKPYRQQKQRHEKTLEQEKESEYFNGMAVAKMDFRQKQGRQPTNKELLKLQDMVKKKVYGTDETNTLQE